MVSSPYGPEIDSSAADDGSDSRDADRGTEKWVRRKTIAASPATNITHEGGRANPPLGQRSGRLRAQEPLGRTGLGFQSHERMPIPRRASVGAARNRAPEAAGLALLHIHLLHVALAHF